MENKDELKEIDIKNWDRDIDFSDNLLDEKLYKDKTKICKIFKFVVIFILIYRFCNGEIIYRFHNQDAKGF